MTNVERFLRCPQGLSGGKGETTTVTQTAIPEKSPEELSLLKKQNDLLEIQLQEVKRQNDALAEVFPQQKELLKAQTSAALSQVELFRSSMKLLEETPAQKEIRELSEQRAIATLKGEAPPLSPQQEKQIEGLYGAAETAGQRGIRQFAEELAASRGLRLTDTPIGAEVLTKEREFQEALQGAKAGAKLNVGQSQQVFTENVRQFQEGLRQTAFQNRLALVGRSATPTFATGLAGTSAAQISPLLSTLSQERIAGATKTQTESGGGTDLAGIGSLLGGAGSALSGLVAAGPALGSAGSAVMSLLPLIGFSSAKFKRDILPLDRDEYDRALARVRETPITRYRYKWEANRGPKHIGPILELAPPEITDDGETVNLLDYAGLQHAALKAVDRKVEALTRALVELVKGRDGKYAYAG